MGDCGMIIAQAQSCIGNVIKSVQDGIVTVRTLRILEKHSGQFLNLASIQDMSQNSTKKGPQNKSASTRDIFQQRLDELKAFFQLKDELKNLLNLMDIFTSGMYIYYLHV